MIMRTKAIFLIGFFLIVYGYLCRELRFYFFWDSKFFGWAIIFIGIISYLFDLNRVRIKGGKKTFWVKIAISILILSFIIGGVVTFDLKTTNAYQTATEYLKTNLQLKDEIGTINGFGLIQTGEVSTNKVNGIESGDAVFFLTVKGNKKYKDIKITLEKKPEKDWEVVSVE